MTNSRPLYASLFKLDPVIGMLPHPTYRGSACACLIRVTLGASPGSPERSTAQRPKLTEDADFWCQGLIDWSTAADNAACLLHHCPDGIKKLYFFGPHGRKALAYLDKTEDTSSIDESGSAFQQGFA